MPKIILGVELYELNEVAEMLGVSIQTMRSYVRKGTIKTTLIGRSKYITTETLRKFLCTSEQGGK